MYLRTWGMISVNLALFNLLPFPGLDGWQILVEIIEGSVNGIKRIGYKAKKDIDLTTKPNQFTSSDGFTILVGKNNKQNDYLTLRIADPEDLWMHTKNIPGSHVIIKCAGKEVPDNTLLEAATLAAYFSKARLSSQVPVDYTMKKHVKKPSGSKPGMVIYETNSTVYVTPNEELVVKLKNN